MAQSSLKRINNRFILSFSMSNYLLYGGGTNLVVSSHQKLFNANEISYICIAPFLLHGKMVDKLRDFWSLIIDGEQKGVLSTLHLIQFIKRIEAEGETLTAIHIHHWKDTDFECFQQIMNTLDGQVFMFIHDYSTVCSNFTLLRGSEFCGYGKLEESRCHGCEYYSDSLRKKMIYERIWNALQKRIHFVFPSEVAQNVWISAYPQYRHLCSVIPHQCCSGSYSGNMGETKEKLNIAYVGSREHYKGWNVFLELYNLKKNDKCFDWFYIGTDKTEIEGIQDIYADNRIDPMSMMNALRSNKIDVAVLWSLCKETYSYTYFECFSANVFVVTNKNSGNIAFQVEKNGNGMVADSIGDLLDLTNEELKKKIDLFKYGKLRGPETLSTNKQILNCSLPFEVKDAVLPKRIRCNIVESALLLLEKLIPAIRGKK